MTPQNRPMDDDVFRWFMYGMGAFAAIAAVLNVVIVVGIVADWGIYQSIHWLGEAVVVVCGVLVGAVATGFVIDWAI